VYIDLIVDVVCSGDQLALPENEPIREVTSPPVEEQGP